MNKKESASLVGIPKQGFVVAIDGPAGTGKSSVTKRLAESLHFTHVDTGALYRAIAFQLMKANKKPSEKRAIQVANDLRLEFKRVSKKNPSNRIYADGKDVTDHIRTPEVSMASSRISAIPGVRGALLGLQRRMGCRTNSILEGRDIGTVIFPDADLKFFMIAAPDERAKRRLAELEAAGKDAPSFAEVKKQILERDRKDSTRSIAPLRRAKDAVVIDTTHLTLDEVVNCLEAIIRIRMARTK